MKIGIAIYDSGERWAIILAENNYLLEQVHFYKIVSRANRTWLRTNHQNVVASEMGFEGILHVADLPWDMSRMHGRMQNVYSGEGPGSHANPTDLPWGCKPWVVRALRMMADYDDVPIPNVSDRRMPRYIEDRIRIMMNTNPRVAVSLL